MSSGHPGLINDFIEKGEPFHWSDKNLKEIGKLNMKDFDVEWYEP